MVANLIVFKGQEMKKLLIALSGFAAIATSAYASPNAAQQACQTAPITCKSNAPQVGFKCTMTSGGKTYMLNGNGVAQSTVETSLRQQCSVDHANK